MEQVSRVKAHVESHNVLERVGVWVGWAGIAVVVARVGGGEIWISIWRIIISIWIILIEKIGEGVLHEFKTFLKIEGNVGFHFIFGLSAGHFVVADSVEGLLDVVLVHGNEQLGIFVDLGSIKISRWENGIIVSGHVSGSLKLLKVA